MIIKKGKLVNLVKEVLKKEIKTKVSCHLFQTSQNKRILILDLLIKIKVKLILLTKKIYLTSLLHLKQVNSQ